jgi:hypothetical protein
MPLLLGPGPPISWSASVVDEQLDTKARSFAIKTYWQGGRGKFINTDDVLDYKSDYTVSFWIRPDAWYREYHHVFDIGKAWNLGNRDSFNLHDVSGGIRKVRAVRQRAGTGLGNDGATTIDIGTWYHIAIVGNSTDLRIFLNGVLEATSTYSNAAGSDSDTMTLAHYMGDTPQIGHEEFEGPYASIKMWQAELTLAEIRQEMYSIRPLRSANLFSFYTEFLNSGIIPDMTGNGRHFKKFVINAPGYTLEPGPPISWGSMVLSEAAAGGAEEEERLMQLLLMGGRKVLAPRSRL